MFLVESWSISISHVTLLPFLLSGFPWLPVVFLSGYLQGIFLSFTSLPCHPITHFYQYFFMSLAMPQVCVLTNGECGRLCHQVFLLRCRTRWDKQCPPVCPNCGCLSRALSTGWWATGLMAMKDKVPAVNTKGKDQGSQLLTSSATLLLINFLVTISLFPELLLFCLRSKDFHSGINI